jgi:ketosteroid isomerase-like protein
MDNVEFVKGLYAAFAAGDVPKVLGSMSEDIEWWEAEGNPWYPGRAFIGPQQVVDGVFARIGAEMEGFEVVPEHFLSDGDQVVMIGRYRGKGIATGNVFDAQALHIWTVRDGKVVRFQQFVDTRQLAEVLGASSGA